MTIEQLQAKLAGNPALARANASNPDEAVQAVTVTAGRRDDAATDSGGVGRDGNRLCGGGDMDGVVVARRDNRKAPTAKRAPRKVTPGRDDSPLVVRQQFSSRDEEPQS